MSSSEENGIDLDSVDSISVLDLRRKQTGYLKNVKVLSKISVSMAGSDSFYWSAAVKFMHSRNQNGHKTGKWAQLARTKYSCISAKLIFNWLDLKN